MFNTCGENIFSRSCFSEIPLLLPSSRSVSNCSKESENYCLKDTTYISWLPFEPKESIPCFCHSGQPSSNTQQMRISHNHWTNGMNFLYCWHHNKFPTWISLRIAEKSENRRPGKCRNSPHSINSLLSSAFCTVCTSCKTRGRRVQISWPLGKKSRPTSASSTLDLPLLWLPTTATWQKTKLSAVCKDLTNKDCLSWQTDELHSFCIHQLSSLASKIQQHNFTLHLCATDAQDLCNHNTLRASPPALSIWPYTENLGWGTAVKSDGFTGRLLWPWKSPQFSTPWNILINTVNSYLLTASYLSLAR